MGVEGSAEFIYTQIIKQMENYTIILFVLGVMV
jgi:hypothetical protein